MVTPTDGPVAVTGVSGFTGGWMVTELVAHGYTVHACLRDQAGSRGQSATEYFDTLGESVRVYDGCDLFVRGSFDAAFKGCSAVFHVAAVLGNSRDNQPTGSGNVDEDTYNGGVVGTQNIIDAVNHSGSVKRLIYTSSVAAIFHDDKPEGYEWAETDWASDSAAPLSSYARSKVDTEKMVMAAADDSGSWSAVSINPAHIVGPMLFKAQYGVWPEQIGQICEGGTVPDGRWNIIDVRDLVAAHRLAAESDVDHNATVGGARYQLCTTDGQMFVTTSARVRQTVPGLTERIQKLFPTFANLRGLQDPSGWGRRGWSPASAKWTNRGDAAKARSVLGVTTRSVNETLFDTISSLVELELIRPNITDVASQTVDPSSSHEEKPKL